MTQIVTADIGGTHARFAIAEICGGAVVRLDPPVTLKVDQFAGLPQAWQAFCATLDREVPRLAAFGLATTIMGEELKMTNNHWIVRPALLNGQLGLDRHLLLNDFAAVAHAVAQLGPDQFAPVCGPTIPLPKGGAISVIGPGTGLGVASLLRADDHYHVVETEGGHIEYAALDPIDDAIIAPLRAQFERVSAERVISGSGLQLIYAALAALDGRDVPSLSDVVLWERALSGGDPLASAALERFCQSFGSVAGDVVLAQGGRALVIAGGLGLRLAGMLGGSGFASRFFAKGRYRQLMETIPVSLITHPQPGLFGAAAAFAREMEQ